MNKKRIIILISILITLAFSACTDVTEKGKEVNTVTDEEQESSAPAEDFAVTTETTPEPTPESMPPISELTDDYVINWKDSNLEARMREATGIYDRDIVYNDVKNITELNLESYDAHKYDDPDKIVNISVLQYLVNLEILYLGDNQISDISALSNLTNLKILGLSHNPITDISALSNLINLEKLQLSSLSEVSDISALANLTNVVELNLSNNQISDISALSDMTDLKYLYLYNNQISDISALSNLTSLEFISLMNNPITDYSPVSHVPNVD